MILPYGLESSRTLIELNVRIYSADVLLKYRVTKFERLKSRIKNLTKNLAWSDNLDNEEFFTDYDSEHVVLDLDEDNGNKQESTKISEDLNLFVQVTFCGVTVKFKNNSFPKFVLKKIMFREGHPQSDLRANSTGTSHLNLFIYFRV